MKPASIILVSTLLCGNAHAFEYKGNDSDSFEKFVDKNTLDWPSPEKIGFFEPIAGKGLVRYANWVPKNNGNNNVVVHFNGRTEFIERNIYTYIDLVDRGYEVWSLDWRGQGLSTHDLKEKQKHNISSFDEYLGDANYFIDEVVKLNKYQGKKILLAHSMGGQIALRFMLQEDRSKFDFAILSSPLLKIPSDSFFLRRGNDLKRLFSAGNSCVLSKSPDWVSDFKKGESCKLMKFEQIAHTELIDANETKKYSNDFNKMAEINCLIESRINARGVENSDLRLACPTSNWLNAAFESTDITMDLASKLNTPTLIIRANPDNAVDPSGQDEFCSLSNNCRLETVPVIEGIQSGHEILIEKEVIRNYFFSWFDKHVGIN
jgi:lysophospholipase